MNMKKIGCGATADIYRFENKVVKIYQPKALHDAYKEFNNLRIINKLGLDVPNVYSIKIINDKTKGLEMDYIDGLTLINENTTPDDFEFVIKTLVHHQRQLHQIQTSVLPSLSSLLLEKIEITSVKKNLKKSLKDMLLQSSFIENRVCHMDFHPFNLILSKEKIYIIDWVDATSGDPIIDICRTYLLLSSSSKSLGTLYLTHFEEKNDILRWLPVLACTRLTEQPDEQELNYLHSILLDFEKNLTRERG